MSIGVLGPLLILLTLLLFLLLPKRRAILLGVKCKLLFRCEPRFGRRSVTRVVSMYDQTRKRWVGSPSASNNVPSLPLDFEILLDSHSGEAMVRTEYLLAELLAVGCRGQNSEWAEGLVRC